ncbi:transposase, partial [Galbibacter marinus]
RTSLGVVQGDVYHRTRNQGKHSRDQRIKPILQRIRNWIEENSLQVLPKSAIGKAMTYFVLQCPKLENVLIDG